jgi:hypothetical protein
LSVLRSEFAHGSYLLNSTLRTLNLKIPNLMADHKANKQGESHQGGPNVAKQAAGTGEDNDKGRDEQAEKRLREEAQDAPHTHPNR